MSLSETGTYLSVIFSHMEAHTTQLNFSLDVNLIGHAALFPQCISITWHLCVYVCVKKLIKCWTPSKDMKSFLS